MDNHSILLEKIENYRHEMLELSKQYGLTSLAVIKVSKQLDDLLNEYQNAERLQKGNYESLSLHI
ncbi:aspartyl-phosphate phosphatase Spo0E family protein [Lentibacillus sp. CBA3610]|uniref:aspartyl-phosphate phosphatase Spo0E family protein n=1 Tax=Lentibacillus sp. CBA3610 TaxID=2518176 RepID=UPI001595A9AE|nr:aspartyl-phosphate phosphatase Spo0E family protein [Lentibacillus sp. CBA3610]QKY71008.1 aspartyl-phosphate phosphatase Spo0E family protein [Lentibacillus sp. CBA3610]